MNMTKWMLVGLLGLLVAGCALPTPLPAAPTVVPTHTSAPTITPIPWTTQYTALPPTSTVAPIPVLEATPTIPADSDHFASLLTALEAANSSADQGMLPADVNEALEPFYAAPASETERLTGATDTYYYAVRAEGDLPLLVVGLPRELYLFWRDSSGPHYARYGRFGKQSNLLSLEFYAPPAAVRAVKGEKGWEMGVIHVGVYSTGNAVYQLLRLDDDTWRVVWKPWPDAGDAWSSSSGRVEFLGEGIDRFRLTGPIPDDVEASQVFVEFGVYAKQQYESIWERRGDEYVRVEGHIIPTPMTVLSDFIAALQIGDREAAAAFVTDPTLLNQALAFDWNESDHKWLPSYVNRQGQLGIGDIIRFWDNQDRARHYQVTFLPTGEDWLIDDIETLMPVPDPGQELSATPSPTLTEGGEVVTFTIVYDNNSYDERLHTEWGFGCWVETEETTAETSAVLFDTGGKGATLLSNMATLGLDPREIDAVVLSHIHGDHTGGLGALLGTGVKPTIYVPISFPAAFKSDVRALTDVVEVTGPVEIAPGIYSTGEVSGGIIEQALAVESEDGLVVVTGCAHPGVDKMVRRARESSGGDVALVMGGFHLGSASRSRVERIIADFREMGVQRVAPCHCTGDGARRMFHDAFGEEYVPAGVGWSVTFTR